MGIDLSSLIKVYPYGFLKITRENPNHNVVNHVMFEKCYHQFPIKLKAFCVCIPCIHCIYCLIIDSAYIKNFSSFFFFAIFLFLAYKQGNPFDDWVDIIFSKKIIIPVGLVLTLCELRRTLPLSSLHAIQVSFFFHLFILFLWVIPFG